MAYFLDNYPVSEQCANLVLTEEQEKYCRVVYKLCEDEDGAYFYELWNPDKEYSDEYVIVPVRSTGGTSVELDPKGLIWPVNYFANVLGSSQDPKPKQEYWIDYWKRITNRTDMSCSTDGKFYYDEDGDEKEFDKIWYKVNEIEEFYVNANCAGKICGSHIIINAKTATTVAEDSGKVVYIVPLCDKHNIAHTKNHRWGAGYYMKLKGKVCSVKLEGYLKKPKKYIEQIKNRG